MTRCIPVGRTCPTTGELRPETDPNHRGVGAMTRDATDPGKGRMRENRTENVVQLTFRDWNEEIIWIANKGNA